MSNLLNVRRFLALMLVVALAAFVGACGDDDDSGGASTSGGDSTTASDRSPQLDEDWEAWTTPPTEIPVSEPLPEPAPEGLSIAYITCGLPTCTTISESVKAAAETLGWEFTALGTEPTPEAIKAAWGQAVRLEPDAVLASGFPRSVFEPELQQLKEKGIGVFQCCAPDAPGDGITMSVVRPEEEEVQGEYTAAIAAKLTEGTPNVLYVNLPEFAAVEPQYPRFVEKLEEYAPGATADKIDIPNTAIGTTSADRIVSYLRSHPDVNFVSLSQDALSAGLPAAMKAAGLDVPFSGNGGGPQPRQMVASGQQAASVEFPIDQVFWTLVDGVARWKLDVSTEPDAAAVTPPPYFIVNADNVESAPSTIVENLQEQYAELWGR